MMEQTQKRIAILYIAIGKYTIFLEGFYASCEDHFYPGIPKDYFVFTDNNELIRNSKENVHPIFQANSGWPFNTLLRYHWFCSIQDKLKAYAYCYFFNANSVVLRDITSEMIPLPNDDLPLVLAIHPNAYDDKWGKNFTPERNPASQAYIPFDQECREVMGGFWGGTGTAIVQMCNELRDAVFTDLSNGVIAVWHDQSHIQKYAIGHAYYRVERDWISSEEYMVPETCLIEFLNKADFGGTSFMRGSGNVIGATIVKIKNKIKKTRFGKWLLKIKRSMKKRG